MRTTVVLCIVILFSGCTQEESFPSPHQGTENDAVVITLNMLSPRTVGTYAMTAKQECDVETIDVLVFGTDDKFLFREKGTNITDGSTDTKKKFSVNIKQTTTPSSVTAFVYTNVRAQIDDAINDWITTNTTKDGVIAGLTFDLPIDPAQGGKWLVLPESYTHFPMWGQTGTINLAAATIDIPEVNMIRAVAKIDVGLNFPITGTQAEQDIAAGLSNFYLEEFYLYNAYDKLQIAPTATNLSGTTVSDPSLPPGTSVFGNAANPIAYARRTYNADGYKSFMSEMYLAEHEAGSDSDRPNNTCIVVGGRFGTQTSAITYYRIDMVKNTVDGNGEVTAQEYLPILRNHRYKVNITAVNGRGYDTAKEAFDAMGLNTNLTVVITCQDEKVTEITHDGQYMLGVDRATVNVDNRASAVKEVYVKTDYPEGWVATVNSEAATWLLLEQDYKSGDSGGSYLKFHTTAFDSGSAPRSGIITIQAGRLFMDVQVIQSHIADIVDIEFTNVAAVYIMDGTNQTFTVKSKYDWRVKIEDESTYITEFDASGSGNPSAITYNLRLDEYIQMDIEADKLITLTFYSPNGEFDPQTVTIRAMSFFDIAGVQMYPIDQAHNKTWYVYGNAEDDVRNYIVPRYGALNQVTPPREFSCAKLLGIPGTREWRLPTSTELSAINDRVVDEATMRTYYNFTIEFFLPFYWSATTTTDTNIYALGSYISWSNSFAQVSKDAIFYSARCVRDK